MDDAQILVSAALDFARQKGFAITVAVLDDAGIPMLLSRLDEASPASVTTSIEKARSAGLTGLPTKTLEAMVSARPALVTLGRVAVEGGLPIIFQGQRMGGIGVSGVRSDQDAQVAQAGLEAWNTSNGTDSSPPKTVP